MMRTFLSTALTSGAFLAIAAAAIPATAQVYRWVDARGVVNYTNVPPPNGVQATRVEVAEPRATGLPAIGALPSRHSKLPPAPPPAASGPPGDIDRATLDALGRTLAERSRCGADSGCAHRAQVQGERAIAARNPRHAPGVQASAARGPGLLTEVRAP
jgi:hypothetical protein